ncbi:MULTISPECIES: sulfotransferase [unclassified Moorena]|uniref:sulfotransferase family protein n=1 Tax=unclassified Moorena TaxID=2683338 RepID=UPI0013C5ED9E|nr:MULTISPECIES: sulfotransferase [unclassified Moorena]NEO19903.1 sulfotransferase [Moorena sp. SIO4A5]NEQ57027.1 sulfotransferase [Moorena sp. SIO4A1]
MESLSQQNQPLFIFGMERSGTTLLRLMLTAHPDFCIPPESLFFVNLEPKYGSSQDLSHQIDNFLTDIYADRRFREWNIDRQQLRENLTAQKPLNYSTAVATVYQTYLQQFDGQAGCWGDKNPENIYHIQTILKYFHNSKLILIIRDLRAIYASLKRKELKFAKTWKESCIANVVATTQQWQHLFQVIKHYQNDQRLYILFYEDLVINPEEELQGICDWLGVSFSESMLEFNQKNAQKNLVATGELGWHVKTFQPVSSDRIQAWKQELRDSELSVLEILNYKTMLNLGYECIPKTWQFDRLLKFYADYSQYIYWKLSKANLQPVIGKIREALVTLKTLQLSMTRNLSQNSIQ